MGDGSSRHAATATRTAIRRFTLVLPPLLMGLGFLGSLFMGCSAPQALLKATAYTLSGLGGWLAYALISSPSDFPLAPAVLVGINVSMLNPTRTPGPFPNMLAHGLIVSILCMSVIGLAVRLAAPGKPARPARVHPLADAEVDPPMSGR